MKKVGIITYDNCHLKTEQILMGLKDRYQLQVYALPYKERKPRQVFFQHRPDQTIALHPQDICRAYGYPFTQVEDDTQIDNDCELYLITGAGIISAECLHNKRVLNCHPGVVPAARGLDAFKWSILKKIPMGVTLHYIDEAVDAGEIITVRETPIFTTDSLQTFARRHYENEIDLLKNFEWHITHPFNEFPDIDRQESTRRMPMNLEKGLMDDFVEYKNIYSRV